MLNTFSRFRLRDSKKALTAVSFARWQHKELFPNLKLKSKINEECEKDRRLWTVPNILTTARIATTPFVGYFICTGMHQHALACFAFAATTDLLDGFIARKFNQQSDVGVMLDPIADKLLISTSIICMYNVELLPMWLTQGLIIREMSLVIGAILFRYYGFQNKPGFKKFFNFKKHPTKGMEPNMFGKLTTATQCMLIPYILATHTTYLGNPIYDWSLLGLELGCTAVAIISWTAYAQRATYFVGFHRRRDI